MYLRVLLFATVFITGASVLIIEVAAVRLLSPYFGSSLYVLSSVLTIVLLALSLGYYAGGKLADRFPFYAVLYSIIISAGLILLFLLLLLQQTLPLLAPEASLLFGPLLFAALFFFIPAFLLGIDSPFVAKLLSREDAAHYGSIVGTTFFWSTAGSIAGSIASGFVLIPLVGLSETMSATGAALVLLGVCGLLLTKARTRRTFHGLTSSFTVVTFILVTAGVIVYHVLTYTMYPNALYENDGYYSHIYIYNDTYAGKPARFLRRDTNSSSAQFLERDELAFWYTQFAPLYARLNPDAESYLVLGGGAYTVPRAIHRIDPEMKIDVVELEPSLYELSKRYFRLPETERIENHVLDARAYLHRTTKTYDVIFVDTFSTGLFIPSHLVTREYLELIKSRLSDDGVVFVNFVGARPGVGEQTLTGSFTKTLTGTFPTVSAYAIKERPRADTQNIMYILQKNDAPARLPDDSPIALYGEGRMLGEFQLSPDTLIRESDVMFTDNNSFSEWLLFKERALN